MSLGLAIDIGFLAAVILTFIGWRANGYEWKWQRKPDPTPPGWVMFALFLVVIIAVLNDALRRLT